MKQQHVHILGICGTFMGGVAVLARQLGFRVTGCDANVYPPMSTYLESQGIEIIQGFEAEQLALQPDQIIVGNAMKRGMPVIEAMLNQNLNYISGPQWLAEQVLKTKWVIAVAGTHGKTTTTSMIMHILQQAGYEPGFLVGGIAQDFGVSSDIGKSDFFVIESDEYDTAFFDKRSKFVHYRPRTLVTNNLEFDHADIFDTVADIQRQFHHLIRTVPSEGLIVENSLSPLLTQAIDKGCWTPRQTFAGPNSAWQYRLLAEDGRAFTVVFQGQEQGTVHWQTLGIHNVQNALAALAAAHHVGVPIAQGIAALSSFKGVKRRMELRGEVKGVRVYDDFAHHPTAIEVTLHGVRQHIGPGERIIALLEPRSNTMKMGSHGEHVCSALQIADQIKIFEPPSLSWSLRDIFTHSQRPVTIYSGIDELVSAVVADARPGDHVVVMSNGGFGGIHEKLLSRLRA